MRRDLMVRRDLSVGREDENATNEEGPGRRSSIVKKMRM